MKSMTEVIEPAVWNDWHVAGLASEVTAHRGMETTLLGQRIRLSRSEFGDVECVRIKGRNNGEPVDVKERFGHVWACLGKAQRDVFEIPEIGREGQRFVLYGGIFLPTSGLRIVENFLDFAHLPFVHPPILGEEPHTAVSKHQVHLRHDPDEIHVTGVKIFQPQAATVGIPTPASLSKGWVNEYTWRILSPFVIIMSKQSGGQPGNYDVIGLFVQPVKKEEAVMYGFAAVYDDDSSDEEILYWHHSILGEDRRILVNQRPKSLPLSPGAEIPNRGDAASNVYRRWLSELGIRYGALH